MFLHATECPDQFEVTEDRRAHLAYGDAVWVSRPGFGEVKEFMSTAWKGEPLQPAIIESWDTESWIPGQGEGRGPHLLLRPRALLPVIEVEAILELLEGSHETTSTGSSHSTSPLALWALLFNLHELYEISIQPEHASIRDVYAV